MSTSLSARNFVAVLALTTALVPSAARAAEIGKPVTAGGFTFINFDPTLSGTSVGSNVNGISNRGRVAGTTVDANNAATFHNFTGTPARTLPLNTGSNATALAIDSYGNVVGTENGVAFFLPRHGAPETLAVPAGATNAFGINDQGNIVGQYTDPNGNNFGFLLRNHRSNTFTAIHAPGPSTVVNSQGINNFGQIVGFYMGADGQAHGFKAEAKYGHNAVLTGTAIADPVIPNVAGEPGATFVFSQILGINDQGIAVGYYGDSTASQHGFLYDTNTGKYTFLDDPSEAFSNGVEVTQITGIADSGELSGFYTDATGAAHSFIACPAWAYCPNFPNLLDGSDESDDR